MACFLVSTAEAVIVTAVEKAEEKKELTQEQEESVRIPLSHKLKWLMHMLWGGSILLMFEHIWHGEITAWFPFLTAMSDSSDTAGMLHEMATVGVSMAALITLVWIVMCVAADAIVRRTTKTAKGDAK